jgi:hypothetical protein
MRPLLFYDQLQQQYTIAAAAAAAAAAALCGSVSTELKLQDGELVPRHC